MQFVQSTLGNIKLWQYVVWKLENRRKKVGVNH